MSNQLLIDNRHLEQKFGTYRVGNAAQLTDLMLLSQVQDYKRLTSSRMIPLDRTEITKRVPAAEYYASRKLDGEFNCLVYRHGQALLINPGGTVRTGLPATDEAAKLLQAQGIDSAILVGELHSMSPDGKRERIHDVVRFARAPQSQAELDALHFSVFDILEQNAARPWANFSETWQEIDKLFGQGQRVQPVPTTVVKNSQEVEKLFQDVVDEKGGEGIVLRSDSAGLFKIKPRHTLDAVIIGFTESTGDRAGMMHDLLLAVRRKDDTFHVLCRVGGGFSEELRRSLLSDLKDLLVESEYAEVNSDHVAYQMVEPKLVVEISCLDLISQSTRGAPLSRMTVDWDEPARTYRIVRRLPLVSVISPQFVRFREDKTIAYADIRIDQVAQIVDVPMWDRDAKQMTLPKSELMKREVFTKQLKGETMVRKLVMWKTNKEQASSDHPAYVVHYTDFSPNRAQPLAREVRVSHSPEQIELLYSELKEENIKKGWEAVSPATTATVKPTTGPVEVEQAPAPKPKKASGKKKAEPAEEPKAEKPAKVEAAATAVEEVKPKGRGRKKPEAEPTSVPAEEPKAEKPAKAPRKKKAK